VKIAPDLDDEAIDAVCALAVELGLAGIIATNTTNRPRRAGHRPGRRRGGRGRGAQRRPLAERSLAVLRRVRAAVPADLCVIAVGGIDTAEDAAARLEAGATLVQGYTAFLYRGPAWARQVTRGLAAIDRRGAASH